MACHTTGDPTGGICFGTIHSIKKGNSFIVFICNNSANARGICEVARGSSGHDISRATLNETLRAIEMDLKKLERLRAMLWESSGRGHEGSFPEAGFVSRTL